MFPPVLLRASSTQVCCASALHIRGDIVTRLASGRGNNFEQRRSPLLRKSRDTALGELSMLVAEALVPAR
jgi:hypothetical protein